MRVKDIRSHFVHLYKHKLIINDTIEIINCSFISDEESIFGELNMDYIKREIEWYESKSLNINDIKGNIPKIWKDVASKDGTINSNYGWCIFSKDNGYQLNNSINALIKNKHSRQATMIYIRPSMHKDAIENGMKDFMCTYSVQLMIRSNKLHYMVYMRSNDAVFGYKNDRYWHNYIHDFVMERLRLEYRDIEKGNLYWNVASMHIYSRHFNLIEKYINENHN